jgi:transcriptional regulator with XRE-family HTH domain
MCVGQKIKKFIIDNGITQTHISTKTGISLSKLNLALNGSRRMTFEEYELICGVLNVNTDKFLEPKKPEIEQSQDSLSHKPS